MKQSNENKIVDFGSSSPNSIPRSDDLRPSVPVVDFVFTSSERLDDSTIEIDRLDMNSPPSTAKAKVKLKATPDLVANPEKVVHDLSLKSSENVGVNGKVNEEKVEEQRSDLSQLSSKALELLKQDMVASTEVVHDYLQKISETVGHWESN